MKSIKPVTRELEKTLKALANRRRLAALSFLKRRGEAHVLDISGELDLSFRSTSRHLGILRAAGIVDREQRDIHMWYRLSNSQLDAAKRLIELL